MDAPDVGARPRGPFLPAGARALLAVSLAACSARPDQVVRSEVSLAIDQVVQEAVEAGRVAGASVGVALGNGVVHMAGYGYADLENQLPATPGTVYTVGSITKQFTAAAMMQLAERGLIRLDAPLTTYLPEFTGPASDVTVAMLLDHTSGIPNYTTMPAWWETLAVEMTPERMTRIFRDEPLDFPPGTRFSYSNSGYFTLGYLIERVSGQPYGGYLNEHLFVPNGLSSTRYCDDRSLVPNVARPYEVVEGELRHPPHLSESQAYAAGAVCSNVLDLLRWTRRLADGRVVDPASYEAMVRPATLADGTPIEYGYGLALGYLDGHRRIMHFGGTIGYTGQLAHYPDDDLTVAVLTNTQEAPAAAIETAIARRLLDLPAPIVREVVLAADELDRYVGTYDLSITMVDVVQRDGRLYVDVEAPGFAGRYALLPLGERAFQAEHDSEIRLTFEAGAGPASGFVLEHRGITMRAERVGAEVAGGA